MKTKTIKWDGHEFRVSAAERAELHEDNDGALWRVPCDDGYYETTDEGLRLLRDAIAEQSAD